MNDDYNDDDDQAIQQSQEMIPEPGFDDMKGEDPDDIENLRISMSLEDEIQ